MRPHLFKLMEDGEIVATFNVVDWAIWFETHECRILKTTIGEVWVSTVFLGVESGFKESGLPMLFETMVFGEGVPGLHPGFWSRSMWRYDGLDRAKRGHELAVLRCLEFLTGECPETIEFPFGKFVARASRCSKS